MSFFNSLFQDTRSPIQQRTTLRSLSYLSFGVMVLICATPYIQNMMASRDRHIAKQTAETTQSEAVEQRKNDLESENKVFQAEVEAKRKRAAALQKIGVGFVDGEIIEGKPILWQDKPGKVLPDNTVVENMEGDRAVIKNGKAVIIKRGSSK